MLCSKGNRSNIVNCTFATLSGSQVTTAVEGVLEYHDCPPIQTNYLKRSMLTSVVLVELLGRRESIRFESQCLPEFGGMMNDLILGCGLLAGLAATLFCLGRWIGLTRTVPQAYFLAVVTLLGLGGYLFWLRDNILLARLLPFSNLIVIGNWLPLWMSLLAGIVWSLLPRLDATTRAAKLQSDPSPATDTVRNRDTQKVPLGVSVRRIVVVVFLQTFGWGTVVQSIWGQPPACRNQWEGEICIQTDNFSCSAACAATLLKAHGIESTEEEMANLCLTRSKGTLWQGLYRGLKLKTLGTDWDVEVVSGTVEDLRSLGEGPAILAAGIPRGAKVPAIYTEEYGWTPGELHSVLFFGFRGEGLVAMGEPTPGVGKENWSEEDLRVLYRGRGMRLVSRR